jgi:hypothetical protein
MPRSLGSFIVGLLETAGGVMDGFPKLTSGVILKVRAHLGDGFEEELFLREFSSAFHEAIVERCPDLSFFFHHLSNEVTAPGHDKFAGAGVLQSVLAIISRKGAIQANDGAQWI